MKSRYFREVAESRYNKPWSSYNVIPTGISDSDRNSCESCGYRADRLKEVFVRTVLGLVGLDSAKYDSRKYCSFTPNCDRKRCLLDKLVLSRGRKPPLLF